MLEREGPGEGDEAALCDLRFRPFVLIVRRSMCCWKVNSDGRSIAETVRL